MRVQILTATTVLLAAVTTGCSSAVPTDTPGVERLGAAVLRYQGPEIEAVLGTRFAAANPGIDWLLLDLAVTGSEGQGVEIEREKLFVRTPAGDEILLASQEEFSAAYPGLQSTIARASIAADPLDYFTGRMPCAIQFFAAPGEGLSFDMVSVNDRRVCFGRLFFAVPRGVQEGRWVLGIDLPESKIRIPFPIGQETR